MFIEINQISTKTWREINVLSSVYRVEIATIIDLEINEADIKTFIICGEVLTVKYQLNMWVKY
jgi:hypothetical protein